MAVQQYTDEELKRFRNCGQPCHEGYEITYFLRDTEGNITDVVATCDDCDCNE